MTLRSRAKALSDKLAVESEPGLTTTQLMLTNHDLKPVEPERRQWGFWNYVGFWIADSFNINTWMISSSMIVAGLSWWQAWLCVWIGYTISATFIVATGRIGAVYHIGFPVVGRASFGIWGTLWPVLNRVVMACIWYGVQSWIGGECVYLMIRAIWNSFSNPWGSLNEQNTPGVIDSAHFVSFILFWLGSLPFLWFPVHKIRHLFTVKAYFVPLAGFAFFGWTIAKAGTIGPIIHAPAEISGSTLAWGIVSGIMSSIANFATLIVNDPDFTRFARKPSDALWSQWITIPLGFAITSFVGIFVSSAANQLYNEKIWNPLDILDRYLDEGGSAQRFGVFIVATAFTLAQLGTNIAANSVSAGTDMSALLPRWINIRRGSYVCALIGLCICPWNMVSGPSNFASYLSSYSVFLSSIAGVIITDYYVVRRGYLQVVDLYSDLKSGPYWYSYGFNWRAYAAYISGILINVVGFAGAVGQDVPIGAKYIYNVNFFSGFIVASGVYWILSTLFKVPGTSDKWLEVGEAVRNPSLAYGHGLPVYERESEAESQEGKAEAKSSWKERSLKIWRTSSSKSDARDETSLP